MIASEFEYRHRFAIVAFVFVFAYAFYNLDPLNIVYAIVPRDLGVLNQDILARFVYSVSALLAGIGAALLTWASASRLSSPGSDLPMGGPYRYVRNPHFIGYFLLVVGLGSFQSSRDSRSSSRRRRSCSFALLRVKRCGWSRRMETAFANIAGVFLGSYPHFAPALRRMASCHADAKPSGIRHSNGAWWLHWPPLPAR